MKKCPLMIILIITVIAVSVPGIIAGVMSGNFLYPAAAVTIHAVKNDQADMLFFGPETIARRLVSLFESTEGMPVIKADPDFSRIAANRDKFFKEHGIDKIVSDNEHKPVRDVVVIDASDNAAARKTALKDIVSVDEILPDSSGSVSGDGVTWNGITSGEEKAVSENGMSSGVETAVSENGIPSGEKAVVSGNDVPEEGTDAKVNEGDGVSDNEAETPETVDVTKLPFTTVGDDYFIDACFAGDSRVQGLGMYSGLPAVNYGVVGVQLYKVFDKKAIKTELGKITIPEALGGPVQYGKIYLGFGLNEMGWGNEEMFAEYYYYLIDYLKAVQPDAIIYLMGVIHVTAGEEARSPLYQNNLIDVRNETIRQVAQNERVIFLDLNEVFTDENGNLPEADSFDGVHIKANAIYKWSDYLKKHAIVK